MIHRSLCHVRFGPRLIEDDDGWQDFWESYLMMPMTQAASRALLRSQGLRQHGLQMQMEDIEERLGERLDVVEEGMMRVNDRLIRVEGVLASDPPTTGTSNGMRPPVPVLPISPVNEATAGIEPLLLMDDDQEQGNDDSQRLEQGNKRPLAEAGMKQEEDGGNEDHPCSQPMAKRPFHGHAGVASFASESLIPSQLPPHVSNPRCPFDSDSDDEAMDQVENSDDEGQAMNRPSWGTSFMSSVVDIFKGRTG